MKIEFSRPSMRGRKIMGNWSIMEISGEQELIVIQKLQLVMMLCLVKIFSCWHLFILTRPGKNVGSVFLY